MVDSAQNSYALRLNKASEGLKKLENARNLVKGSSLEPIFSNKINQLKNPESPINKAFTGLDTDKDGVLSKSEFENSYTQMATNISKNDKSKAGSALDAAFVGWLKGQADENFASAQKTGEKNEMDLYEFFELKEKERKNSANKS